MQIRFKRIKPRRERLYAVLKTAKDGPLSWHNTEICIAHDYYDIDVL